MTVAEATAEEGTDPGTPEGRGGVVGVVGLFLLVVALVTWYVVQRGDDVRPAAAPAAERTGLSLVVRPLASGEVGVRETLRTASPLSTLRLTLPPAVRGAGSSPRVVALTVDGEAVDGSELEPDGLTIRLPRRTDRVSLSYRLAGVSRHRAPATPGRTILQVRPLAFAAGADDVPVVVAVRGDVLNLACPDLPVEDQLCGRETDGSWETTSLPASRSTVVAQVDLPR